MRSISLPRLVGITHGVLFQLLVLVFGSPVMWGNSTDLTECIGRTPVMKEGSHPECDCLVVQLICLRLIHECVDVRG